MRARVYRFDEAEPRSSQPRYELRTRSYGPGDSEIEIWQVPAPATPYIRWPMRIAGLRGRNLELVEHRVLRYLAEHGIRLESSPRDREAARKGTRRPVAEDLAMRLGLILRTLAPMRSRARIRDVVEGIEAMPFEEASYWLGMAMHRKYPRRVLTALRVLLTDPKRNL
jgi:hypothetical protein